MKKKRGKAKPKGELIECPTCQGTGVIKVFTFKEIEEILSRKEGLVKTTFNLGAKKYKVFLKVEEV